jgi:hypothetical protein
MLLSSKVRKMCVKMRINKFEVSISMADHRLEEKGDFDTTDIRIYGGPDFKNDMTDDFLGVMGFEPGYVLSSTADLALVLTHLHTLIGGEKC